MKRRTIFYFVNIIRDYCSKYWLQRYTFDTGYKRRVFTSSHLGNKRHDYVMPRMAFLSLLRYNNNYVLSSSHRNETLELGNTTVKNMFKRHKLNKISRCGSLSQMMIKGCQTKARR